MGADNKPSETPTGMELMMDAAPSILDVLARKDALIRRLERDNRALRLACERALAIEESVTQGQERELRNGYVDMLKAALQGGK